jgi:hypothetical protein
MIFSGSMHRRLTAIGAVVLVVMAAVGVRSTRSDGAENGWPASSEAERNGAAPESGVRVAFASEAPSAPIVHCSWILPATGDGPDATYVPDDDVSIAAGQAGAPCEIGAEGWVHQLVGAPLAQLVVDPENSGAGRTVQLWTAVSHPDGDFFAGGTGAVAWTIKGPDGQTVANVAPNGRSCAGENEPGPMWSAASTDSGGTGVFSRETMTNALAGLWRSCRQGRVRVFVGGFTLPSGSPCGTYAVTTSAVAANTTTTSSYSFVVRCLSGISLDSTAISWNVSAGGTGLVRGDRNPATPDAPTITNNGTKALQLGITFSPLRRPDGTPSSATFGAVLVPAEGDRAALIDVDASHDHWFTGPESVLCPGASVQLNLMVHAPEGLAEGQYSGGVRILSKAGGLC